MARFTTVLFWPPTKHPDPTRPWADDPDVAAWLGTSRRVCEAYSMHLAALGLQGRNSLLQLSCRPFRGDDSAEQFDRADLAAGGAVTAIVNVDRFEGFEMGHVHVPLGVAALSPSERAGLILETVHTLVVALAAYRGWDADALAPVREAVLADGCEFTWEGPWKSAPGRKRQARVVHRLADDGFGRATLEVRDAAGGAVVEIGPALSFTTSESFRRSARTLRWTGKDTVELVPYSGIFGDDRWAMRWDPSGGSVVGPSPSEPASTPPTEVLTGDLATRVSARAEGDVVPGRPAEIRVIGGGPSNGVPGDYQATLHHLWVSLREEAWRDWWEASGEPLLEIWYDYAPRKQGYRVQKTKRAVRATIDRPTSTMVAEPDRVQLGLDDVTALMNAVGRRFDLDPPPRLPSRDEIASATGRAAAQWDRHLKESAAENAVVGAAVKQRLESLGIDTSDFEIAPD